MKIALCLGGYLDSQKDKSSKGIKGFDYINKKIFKGNNVDVYIHSWDLINKSLIEDLYGERIRNSKFERQIDFSQVVEDNNLTCYPMHGTKFENILSQFYSVQESFRTLYQYGENVNYDIVIKGRFDLGFINRNQTSPWISLYSQMRGNGKIYPVQCINFDKSLDMKYIYFPRWAKNRIEDEGFNDMWYYSNNTNMKKFTTFYDFVKLNINNNSDYIKWAGKNFGGPLNAIKILKYFLIQNELFDNVKLLKTTWV
jgi:hypothetical protein|tara:strand:- start:169 stop:933 length:765 start_codon:yes stop_codon:yes gene_type:complete